jgi:hypothetical protein
MNGCLKRSNEREYAGTHLGRSFLAKPASSGQVQAVKDGLSSPVTRRLSYPPKAHGLMDLDRVDSAINDVHGSGVVG